MTAHEARQHRLHGGYIPTAIYLDAKSVFAATTATFIKQPAEKSLLCHVQYLRELLDERIITYIFWIDTRDMGADGLTKGAVARDLLHAHMDGYMPLKHEFSQWCSKGDILSGSRKAEAQEDSNRDHDGVHLCFMSVERSHDHVCTCMSLVPFRSHSPSSPYCSRCCSRVCRLSSRTSHLPSRTLAPPGHCIMASFQSSTHFESTSGTQSGEAGAPRLLDWVEGAGEYPATSLYEQDGEIWRRGTPSTGVKKTVSLSEVQRYVRSIPSNGIMQTYEVPQQVPYNSILDYVCTLRNSAAIGAAFTWPSDAFNDVKGIAVALHHCPPGGMVVIQNRVPIPEKFLEPKASGGTRQGEAIGKGSGSGGGTRKGEASGRSGTTGAGKGGSWQGQWWSGWWSQQTWGSQDWGSWHGHSSSDWWAQSAQQGWAETDTTAESADPHGTYEVTTAHSGTKHGEAKRELKWGVRDYYHGAPVESLPGICQRGIAPSFGAGQEGLLWWHGVPVPGAYVAKSWYVASSYPISCTTGEVTLQGSTYTTGVPGGTLLAEDGTFPMRAVVRCVALENRSLWSKGSNQCLFMPSDLFITHLCIYAVKAELVHMVHMNYEVVERPLTKSMGQALLHSSQMEPVCHLACIAAMATAREETQLAGGSAGEGTRTGELAGDEEEEEEQYPLIVRSLKHCLLYTSPSPRD